MREFLKNSAATFKPSAALRRGIFAFLVVPWVLIPLLSVQAATSCCNCHQAGSKDNICLQTTGSCQTLPSQTGNPAVQKLQCDPNPLNPEACKPVVSGGSAVCQQGPADANAYKGTGSPTQNNVQITAPKLNIPIPGLTFSASVPVVNQTAKMPFIAQYVTAIYNYAIGISLIAAAVMIVYGGFRYIIGSTAGDIMRGKEIVKDALVGLFLMLGSYVILITIGPLFTGTLQPVELQIIQRKEQPIEAEGMDPKVWQKFIKNAGKPEGTPSLGGEVPDKNKEFVSDNPNPNIVPGEAAPPAGGAPTPPAEGAPEGLTNLEYNPSDCKFVMNAAGVPNIESTVECIKTLAKKFNMSPCFGIIAMNYETGGTGLPLVVGHDEETWAAFGPYTDKETKKTVKGDLDLFLHSHDRNMLNFWCASGQKFLESGQTYQKKSFPKCSHTCGANPKCATAEDVFASVSNYLACQKAAGSAWGNDDDMPDPNKDDLGLDWRFSHGVGPGQATVFPGGWCKKGVPSVKVAGLCFTLKQLYTPYGGLWTSLAITKKAGASTNPDPGAINRIWAVFAGAASGQSQMRTMATIGCMQSNPGNPILSLKSSGLSICRGDWGNDRAACEQLNDQRKEANAQNPKDRSKLLPLINCTEGCGRNGGMSWVQRKIYSKLGIHGAACNPRAVDKNGVQKTCPPLEFPAK